MQDVCSASVVPRAPGASSAGAQTGDSQAPQSALTQQSTCSLTYSAVGAQLASQLNAWLVQYAAMMTTEINGASPGSTPSVKGLSITTSASSWFAKDFLLSQGDGFVSMQLQHVPFSVTYSQRVGGEGTTAYRAVTEQLHLKLLGRLKNNPAADCSMEAEIDHIMWHQHGSNTATQTMQVVMRILDTRAALNGVLVFPGQQQVDSWVYSSNSSAASV